MTSLVVGATGIVGGYIVEHLVRNGEKPIAFSRSRRRDDKIEWRHVDLAAVTMLEPVA
jgi:uncharacterized protein YbjT (DUF2867 family)